MKLYETDLFCVTCIPTGKRRAGQKNSVAVTTEKVIALVSNGYGIGPEELGQGGKHRNRSEARAVAGLDW